VRGFVNSDKHQENGLCPSCRTPMPCAACDEHGPVTALFMGLHHSIAFREDGTGTACYGWSKTARQTHARLRTSRDGGVVPEERGRRRGEIVRDLSGMFRMVESDRRGPKSGQMVPSALVRAEVDERVARGATKATVFRDLAEEMGWSAETIKRHYYGRDRP
jgi:hypothetical protein